jgi:hypothetical protein
MIVQQGWRCDAVLESNGEADQKKRTPIIAKTTQSMKWAWQAVH